MDSMERRLESMEGRIDSINTRLESCENKVVEKADEQMRANSERNTLLLTTTKEAIRTGLQTVRHEVETSTKTLKTHTNTSQKQTIKTINTNLDKQLQFHNRDLTDVIEKEAQLSRDIARGGPHSGLRQRYECVLRVRHFASRVKSDVGVYSCPWYIHQLDTCVKGYAKFLTDGTLVVKLIDGRYPSAVGLVPGGRKYFRYTVSVYDEEDASKVKVLEDDAEVDIDESTQGVRGAYGCNIATLSCQSLVDDGFVRDDVLLVKYVITV